MGLKGQVVPISIPFYASSSGPYGLPCFNQRQHEIPVESMKSTYSPVYSTPLRRLLTTNRQFLKLGIFGTKNQAILFPFLLNPARDNRQFLKLGSFCPKVRHFAAEVRLQMLKKQHWSSQLQIRVHCSFLCFSPGIPIWYPNKPWNITCLLKRVRRSADCWKYVPGRLFMASCFKTRCYKPKGLPLMNSRTSMNIKAEKCEPNFCSRFCIAATRNAGIQPNPATWDYR